MNQQTIFLTLLVIAVLIIGFFFFHVYLPDRAERRRLIKKMNALPKAGLIADSKLSAEFEERRLRVLNDSGVHGDWGLPSPGSTMLVPIGISIEVFEKALYNNLNDELSKHILSELEVSEG